MASISGTVTVAGDPDDWIACAFDADTHAYAGCATVAEGAYEITGLTAGKAYMVACRPKTGGAWIASSDNYSEGDYTVPTSPETTPYIYKITASSGGSSVSARYWRVNNFVTSSNLLELSEIQLHNNSGNQNSTATITGTAPWNYAISSTTDNNLNTYAYWNTNSGVYIHWDFGTSKEITHIKLGSNNNSTRFPSNVTIEYSTDNSNWITQMTLTGIGYPGDKAYTSLLDILGLPQTGSSEPTWPTTLDDTVEDGDFTWTNMGRLVQPLLQGPLIAAA